MRNRQNIAEIADFEAVGYLGFILYPKSKRYINADTLAAVRMQIPEAVQVVGVFVNEAIETVKRTITRCRLDVIQLHGDESPAYCAELREVGVTVWKVAWVATKEDIDALAPYVEFVDAFLFDTPPIIANPTQEGINERGGTGKKWGIEVLAHYSYELPFWLSGGIDVESVSKINTNQFPMLVGIDVNSKFEIEPALKDVELIKQLTNDKIFS